MTTRIQQLQDEIADWSDSTFGAGRPATTPLHHLAKEVAELIEAPQDRMEYADCLMLLLDAYRMSGGSADDLIDACYQKLAINQKREWGQPDENGVVEHIHS
jgi:dATP/dGTP diphosphohydrolase